MIEDLLSRVPVFVLVVFRLGGMMLFAPLFGSARIPRRVKSMLVLVLAYGMVGAADRPVALPDSTWMLAVGIAGEMAFGLAMGMVMSFTFIAAQWAGEMIGQQMGLNMGSMFDPMFGGGGSLIGDMLFMFTLVVFLVVGGHHAMLIGVGDSFRSLPLLSLSVNESLFELLIGLLQTATTLALRLAAPTLVTMLVVDLALGLLGRTLPQFNVMQAGMSMRSAIGMVVIIVGLTLTSGVIEKALDDAMWTVRSEWNPLPEAGAGG